MRHTVKHLCTLLLALLALLCLGAPVAAAEPPAVSIDPFPTVGYTTAHVSGTVNSHGEEATIYAEYATTATGPFTYVQVQVIPSGSSGSTAVAGEITGLKPDTEYFFRLDAEANHVETYSAEPNPSATTRTAASPSASVDAPGAITTTSATFSGHIDPNAPKPEVSTSSDEQQAFNTSWHFQCNPECSGLSGDVPADDAFHEVSGQATGLLPGTTYEVSLVADNEGGEVTEGPQLFETIAAPPTVAAVAAVETSSAGAAYRPDRSGGSPDVVPLRISDERGLRCTRRLLGPQHDQHAGDLDRHRQRNPRRLSADYGPATGTVYRFRAVVTNSSPGDPVVVSTGKALVAVAAQSGAGAACPNEVLRSENGSLMLPDCRAYERVTPDYKNGAAFGSSSYVADRPRVELKL